MKARFRPSLQRTLTLGVLGYVLLLTVVVLLHGWVINERAEALVWRSLLATEMDYFAAHSDDPAWRPRASGVLQFHDSASGEPLPAPLSSLTPGVEEEISMEGGDVVALVREHEGRRLTLALDITEFERTERELTVLLFISGFVVTLLLGMVVALGVSHLARPLRDLARNIKGLRPDSSGQQLDLPANASGELAVIADAINDYLRRHDQFVERERLFIDTASHELRTPIAVIAGATELALGSEVPASARAQLQRIQRTARGVEGLIMMLLALAKNPDRQAVGGDCIDLDQLLPEIGEDHRHLCGGKSLSLRMGHMAPCRIVAPIGIVQATVGNLLRNAIENSDSGEIQVSLEPQAVVVIDDPGHGMSPEQISAIYARHARGEGRDGGGIGLDLITRLCTHFGWRLDIGPRADRDGTRARLDMGVSRVAQG